MLSNLFPSVVCWAKKILNRGMPGYIIVDCKTKFRHRQKLEIARLSSDGLSLTLAHNHKLNSIIIKNDVVYAYSSNLVSIENTPI